MFQIKWISVADRSPPTSFMVQKISRNLRVKCALLINVPPDAAAAEPPISSPKRARTLIRRRGVLTQNTGFQTKAVLVPVQLPMNVSAAE